VNVTTCEKYNIYYSTIIKKTIIIIRYVNLVVRAVRFESRGSECELHSHRLPLYVPKQRTLTPTLFPGHRTMAAHCSPRGWVKCRESISFLCICDSVITIKAWGKKLGKSKDFLSNFVRHL